MANHNQDWEALGQSIAGIIDRAVESHDFQKLENTVRDTVDRAAGAGSQALHKVVNNAAAWQNSRRYYGSTFLKTLKGVIQLGLGVPFGLAGTATAFFGNVDGTPAWQHPGSMAVLLAMGIGGIWAAVCGARTMGMVSRFKIYRRILGDRTHCKLEMLAQGVGKKVSFVRRELYRMIGKGYFREGHLDKEETRLIISHETYQYYERSRLELEQRQKQQAPAQPQEPAQAQEPTDPKLQQMLDQGAEFIAKIRKCNDDIPGVEISEKISRIELLVQKIYQRAEEDPDIIPELKRLQGYYLPMTVKLLEAYADMDAQPVQGENIQASKREIEDTLDTLNVAFEKLLDSIFKETSLDISSDISALNVLLAQEGLTEDALSKMKSKGE